MMKGIRVSCKKKRELYLKRRESITIQITGCVTNDTAEY
jgi:hypothetical protein